MKRVCALLSSQGCGIVWESFCAPSVGFDVEMI